MCAWSGFNPYFNGYSTLTISEKLPKKFYIVGFNPYFNGYSTLTKIYNFIKDTDYCFNPCFNGYSTLTESYVRENINEIKSFVSILILMDTLL